VQEGAEIKFGHLKVCCETDDDKPMMEAKMMNNSQASLSLGPVLAVLNQNHN
jgi:hypothetical protein